MHVESLLDMEFVSKMPVNFIEMIQFTGILELSIA